MTELLLKEEVFKIVGAAIEVHRELGSGFLEPVYQEAMVIELASASIPFEAQKALQIMYKGHKLKKEDVPDFICYQQIILEAQGPRSTQRRRGGPSSELLESSQNFESHSS